MAVVASFSAATGTLSVFGDTLDNNIVISRNAAGNILVNGGAVAIVGGTPTVANTALIQAFGQGGNDTITLDESNGALPRANLFGGTGNDMLTGGSGGDQLFGQAGNDTLLGKGGFDFLFGGSRQRHPDRRRRRRPGLRRERQRPHDLEPGRRHRPERRRRRHRHHRGQRRRRRRGLHRSPPTAPGCVSTALDPAPFAIDIGTTENLVLNMDGGDDTFSATGNLAALIKLTVDGGAGNDTILGSNGIDLLLGGDGNDFIDGQQGNDVAFLGAGNDVFQWDPGDGSDVVEGQDGTDTMLFNGSAGDEIFAASANGGRVLFTRNLGNIVMDLNDVETIELNALGGTDTVTVDNLAGTDVDAGGHRSRRRDRRHRRRRRRPTP